METGNGISDLPRITNRIDVDGFLVRNKAELKDRYITIEDLLNGLLIPDVSNNIDFLGDISLLNVKDFTTSGVVNLIPYIAIMENEKTTADFNVEIGVEYEKSTNLLEPVLTDFAYKGISIRKDNTKNDYNMLTFPRTGWYAVDANILASITASGGTQGSKQTRVTVTAYEYDLGLDILTEKERYNSTLGGTSLYPYYNNSFVIFVSNPETTRVKLESIVSFTQLSTAGTASVTTNTTLGVYSRR